MLPAGQAVVVLGFAGAWTLLAAAVDCVVGAGPERDRATADARARRVRPRRREPERGDLMSSTTTRPPRGRFRRRLTALAATAALAVAGMAALAAPAHAAAPGVSTAYVANANDNSVSVINTATGVLTATIPVGSHPGSVAATPDRSQVYVTNILGSSVSVINTASGTVTATIPVGAFPVAALVNPAGTQVYVTSLAASTVSVISTATNTVTATIAVSNANNEAINPAGTTLYVSGAPSNVFVIDLATSTITATIPFLGGAQHLAVSPDGSTVYLTQANQKKVSVISTATNTVTATIPTATDAQQVLLNAAGTTAYVSSQGGGDVIVIDTASKTVTTTIPTGSFATGLALTPDGTRLFVTNENANDVSVIDTATNTVTGTFAAGNFPDSIALTTVPAPVVTSISPGSGPLAAGTPVTITGTDLNGATSVTFGADGPATAVSCTATTCTATAPAGTAGTVDVTVTTPGGTSATVAADQYAYVAAPTVTGISPGHGPESGGGTVTITGTNLTGTSAVLFGTTPATSVTVANASTVTATIPAHVDGTVDVTVTTVGGTSATGTADHYTYDEPAPVITGISPTYGDQAGGTMVTITGTDLTGTTAIHFGATAATSFTVVSDTQITATAPAGTALGPVDITVTTPAGTSTTGTADRFSYVNGVGKVTAAGRLPVGGHDAEFGFDARATTPGGTIKGRLIYDDQTSGVKISNSTITVFYLTGTTTAHAEGTATCTIGGTSSPCTFTVTATDPGGFTLTYNTTTVGGTIANGHVHVTPGNGNGGNATPAASRQAQTATTAPVLDATPATAAMTGGFSASLLGVSLSGGRCATATLIYTDGTAAGDTNCLLLGLLGVNIDIDLHLTSGTVGTNTATVTGTATVTVAGLLPVTLPATEVLTASGSTGLRLTVGAVTLPTLPIATGAIQIG